MTLKKLIAEQAKYIGNILYFNYKRRTLNPHDYVKFFKRLKKASYIP